MDEHQESDTYGPNNLNLGLYLQHNSYHFICLLHRKIYIINLVYLIDIVFYMYILIYYSVVFLINFLRTDQEIKAGLN